MGSIWGSRWTSLHSPSSLSFGGAKMTSDFRTWGIAQKTIVASGAIPTIKDKTIAVRAVQGNVILTNVTLKYDTVPANTYSVTVLAGNYIEGLKTATVGAGSPAHVYYFGT